MKKRLFTLQTMTIAFALLFSFGLYTFHALSDVADTPQSTLADQLTVNSGVQQMDFGGHGNGQHSHINECCGYTPQAPVRGPTVSPYTPWRAATKSPTAFSAGPPMRPPRISA